MNIFLLDHNPTVAASMLCDQHLNKMPTEYCQMLACLTTDEALEKYLPYTQKGTPYVRSKSISKHPATLWLKKDTLRVVWLLRNAEAIFHIRRERGQPEHKAKEFIDAWKELHGEILSSVWDIQYTIDMPMFHSLYCIGKDTITRTVHPKLEDNFTSIGAYRIYYKLDKLYWATFNGVKRNDISPYIVFHAEYRHHVDKYLQRVRVPEEFYSEYICDDCVKYGARINSQPTTYHLNIDNTGTPSLR